MIKRKYNLTACLAITVSALLLTLIIGTLQKRYGILTPANVFAFEIVKSVQTFSLNVAMSGVTWFGDAFALMIFICVMYWLGYSTEIVTFLLMVIFGSAIGEHMKESFRMDRPVSSEVPIIGTAEGFGYPSGHSQSGVYYSWLMYAFVGKYWLLCLLPAVLLALSRICLGVHYFSDTVGGVVLGFGIAAGATGIYGYIRDLQLFRESIRRNPALRVVLPLALSFLYMAVAWGQADAFKYGGFLFGFFLVYPALSFRWHSRNPFLTVIAIIISLAVLLGLQMAPPMLGLPGNFVVSYVSYFIQGLLLAISPLLFVKIGLLKKVPAPELEVVTAEEKKEAAQATRV